MHLRVLRDRPAGYCSPGDPVDDSWSPDTADLLVADPGGYSPGLAVPVVHTDWAVRAVRIGLVDRTYPSGAYPDEPPSGVAFSAFEMLKMCRRATRRQIPEGRREKASFNSCNLAPARDD